MPIMQQNKMDEFKVRHTQKQKVRNALPTRDMATSQHLGSSNRTRLADRVYSRQIKDSGNRSGRALCLHQQYLVLKCRHSGWTVFARCLVLNIKMLLILDLCYIAYFC